MRRTATGLRILVTGNGPMNLGASLLQTERSGMFLEESHTFLTNDVYGRLRPVAIGLSLSARSHSEESLTGSSPSVTAPLDEGVGRGDRDFGFQTRKNRWLVT